MRMNTGLFFEKLKKSERIVKQAQAAKRKKNAQHKVINPRQLRSDNFLQFSKNKFKP